MVNAKHLITLKCHRRCSYCINKRIKRKLMPESAFRFLEDAYLTLRNKWNVQHLMLSGGEPFLSEDIWECLATARKVFDKVSIITSLNKAVDIDVVDGNLAPDDMLFSIHDPRDIPEVTTRTPVYASFVARHYSIALLEELCAKGFRGASIREEYPDGEPIRTPIPTFANFSVRYSRKEDCTGGMFMLPDLQIVSGKEFE